MALLATSLTRSSARRTKCGYDEASLAEKRWPIGNCAMKYLRFDEIENESSSLGQLAVLASLMNKLTARRIGSGLSLVRTMRCNARLCARLLTALVPMSERLNRSAPVDRVTRSRPASLKISRAKTQV